MEKSDAVEVSIGKIQHVGADEVVAPKPVQIGVSMSPEMVNKLIQKERSKQKRKHYRVVRTFYKEDGSPITRTDPKVHMSKKERLRARRIADERMKALETSKEIPNEVI